LGALTSFTALESGGKASVVISLISLYPLVTVAFAVTALHERLNGIQALGVCLAIVAAILLSLEPKKNESQP
jgi:transporter family protein